jgi:hypothetical protein
MSADLEEAARDVLGQLEKDAGGKFGALFELLLSPECPPSPILCKAYVCFIAWGIMEHDHG